MSLPLASTNNRLSMTDLLNGHNASTPQKEVFMSVLGSFLEVINRSLGLDLSW
jgi:hypothetical protein